jgi:hypothetical protein
MAFRGGFFRLYPPRLSGRPRPGPTRALPLNQGWGRAVSRARNRRLPCAIRPGVLPKGIAPRRCPSVKTSMEQSPRWIPGALNPSRSRLLVDQCRDDLGRIVLVAAHLGEMALRVLNDCLASSAAFRTAPDGDDSVSAQVGSDVRGLSS